MDKLSEPQRAALTKMSDERLRSKLSRAGYRPEILLQFTREDLLKAMAEVVLVEEERQDQAAAHIGVDKDTEDVEAQENTVEEAGLDRMTEVKMDVEERRLLLEERRLEMEDRKWKAEMQFRERELEKEKQEMDLRARELDLKKIMAEKEQSSRESVANRLKLWGDGLRNAISKMPTEPIEIVSWFIALEKLFDQLEVPAELRSVLIRPYLNERAKALLARCDLEKNW